MEAYRVVAEQLAERDSAEPVDDKALIAECAAGGEQQLVRGRIAAAESNLGGALRRGAAALVEPRAGRRRGPSRRSAAQGRRRRPSELARTLLAGFEMSLRGADVRRLMEIAIAAWAGRAADEIEELGERLFVQQIAGMIYPEAEAPQHRDVGDRAPLRSASA